MNHQSSTSYAVRVIKEDGSVYPDRPEELDWFKLETAKRVAAKAWDARNTVTNSPVVAIEIINADYQTVQRTDFN